MHLALFAILRFLAARQIGQLGVSDLLVIVVIRRRCAERLF
jgi:uncharacterized membrane protein YcaP (DUF421 family)